MKRTALLTIIIALSAALVQASPVMTKVTLKTEVDAQPGTNLTLKDVAGIQAPKTVLDKIGGVLVARVPLAGQSWVMSADSVTRKIVQAVPDAKVTMLGSAEVKITGACSKITAQELAENARQFVLERLPKDNREYDVTVDPVCRHIVAPSGADIKISPEFIAGDIRPGLNSVRLNVTGDGKSLGVTFASVRVKITATVLVAADIITRDTPLSARNTVWDKRDVTKLTNAIVDKGDDSFGQFVAKKTIEPGTVITFADITLPAAVKKGDTIALTVKCGNVELKSTAEARQDGAIGESIRVQTPVSSCEIKAKITEPGRAEISI